MDNKQLTGALSDIAQILEGVNEDLFEAHGGLNKMCGDLTWIVSELESAREVELDKQNGKRVYFVEGQGKDVSGGEMENLDVSTLKIVGEWLSKAATSDHPMRAIVSGITDLKRGKMPGLPPRLDK